jgi:serine/threonine-protein kinase
MQQIEAIFHDACSLAANERVAFLDEACAGDAELQREVELLLASDEAASSTLLGAPAHAVAASLLQNAAALTGQFISHYEITALLGKGGMGEVYQARDAKLDRTVALKILPADVATDAERLRRFVREAKAASALNHPHVATIYEIGAAENVNFIAMEYVAGQPLTAKINGTPLALHEVITIGSQIADALDEAHRKGITHRDIKPANVMLNERGQVKVLDFGLAKITRPPSLESDASTLKQTTPGIVMGTVPYMSPEQALGREVDHRSDIFSLGVVLYEMLTRRRPFDRATVNETLAAILRDEPPPLAEHAPACPASLAQIVTRCLAKAPAERYQTAGEIVVALQAVRDEKAVSKPSGEMAAAPPTLPRAEKVPPPRWRWVAMASASALIVLLAVLYAFRPRETAETPIKTLAVLPPRPLHINGRDEALELGTTSTLITRLGSLRQLIVRPESAVEKYARPEQDPLAAGLEQKVDAVLDSRYQRSGDKLRFTLRLLRVADGATLWADTLDQPTTDAFAIEDALSAKVTGGLKLTLSEADKELLAKRYTKNAEAWQLYARGHHLSQQRGIPNVEKAITYLEQAIALDPDFALAYAELGFCYISLTYGKYPPKELMPKAKAVNDRALKLDDQLAEAHAFSALYKRAYEWDYDGAEREHKRAIELNPNSAEVHRLYAFHLIYTGRFEQGIAEVRRAEDLDPTSPFVSNSLSQIFYFARRYDETIETARRGIDLHSGTEQFYNWMIRAYEMKGDEPGAVAAYLKQAEAEGAGADEIAGMKTAFATGGLKGLWRWQLDRLLEREKREFILQISVALLYTRLGQKEQALARLERAIEDRNHYVIALNVEPVWDSYRSDPRFVALVRRVGLVQ